MGHKEALREVPREEGDALTSPLTYTLKTRTGAPSWKLRRRWYAKACRAGNPWVGRPHRKSLSKGRSTTVCCRKIIALCILVASGSLFARTAPAKQQERPWQTGNVARLERGSCGIFPRCLELSIATEDTVYVCKWTSGRKGLRYRNSRFRIIGPVQFAVKDRDLYIKGAKGKQYKTQLLEKVPIPDKSSSAPEITI